MVGLDDLHAMGHPVDRVEEQIEIAGFWRRRLQAKANLGLNTRVDESGEAHRSAIILCMDERAVASRCGAAGFALR
jgi:hypothetical protein